MHFLTAKSPNQTKFQIVRNDLEHLLLISRFALTFKLTNDYNYGLENSNDKFWRFLGLDLVDECGIGSGGGGTAAGGSKQDEHFVAYKSARIASASTKSRQLNERNR